MEFRRSETAYFVSGDIFAQITGGTLCDRMVAEELKRTRLVQFIVPQIRSLNYTRQLFAGLLNNFRNLFRAFPRRSLLVVDHGVYRDCFIAANVWKWLYQCRVVSLVYHLDYNQPEMRGGQALRTLIEKLMIRSYDFVLTISQSTAEHLADLGFPPERMAQIPVSRRFGPQADLERSSKCESVELLFVGAVQPRKGLRDAIQALSRYRGDRKIVFRCVGSCDPAESYTQELKTTAAQVPGLALEMPGKVSHEALAEYFRQADAFLFPSHWEGYGIAIEEAMCFGLPVIAYHAGSVPELVDDGVTGWLAPVGDINALAQAISECVENPVERRRRGRNGLEKARRLTAAKNLGEILEHAIAAAEENHAS
ncbi:MAG: glycosyltransferase family 4 protein [Chthoniobacterales bacterium]